MYKITRLFMSGNLKGLTFTETTNVAMEVGKVYKPSGKQSSFKIIACTPT